MKWICKLCFMLCILSLSCSSPSSKQTTDIELLVLGIAQDAGYPQANCKKNCCSSLWDDTSKRKMVSCLGIKDPISKKTWLFDATPDFKDQLAILKGDEDYELDGIFLTHAHMGHYTGLMHLGREAMGADSVSVYSMPRMKSFLENNGPWSQLVKLGNIAIRPMQDAASIELAEGRIKVTPFLVPHRDEFSETVGYKIMSDKKSIIYIPDIDKWSKWNTNILDLINEVDLAFLDGTFYRNGEIWGRDMSEIPHPFIEESMNLLEPLSKENKSKVHFIHLNHTNPLLNVNNNEYDLFNKSGFGLAKEGGIFTL